MHQMIVSALVLILLGCTPRLSLSQKLILGGSDGPAIRAKSSDDWMPKGWTDSASASKTLRDQGLIANQLEASRFLTQATLGVKLKEIERVAGMYFEDWIEEQIQIPPSYMLPNMKRIFKEVYDWYFTHSTDSANSPSWPYFVHFNYTWWDTNLRNKDKLRQRIALALSEILVISIQSDLAYYGYALSSYYDLLIKHAFGNYRDLLYDISLHPCMGYYLSHLNNPKSDTALNRYPDENFAREIMQLFTIGLYELNEDGTEKLDPAGNRIPTYGMEDIKELAKVFTGLSFSKLYVRLDPDTATFYTNFYDGDPTYPMRMYDEFHEPGEKRLLNGFVIPAGQSGMEDINMAIDHLFNHPNVGPFISRQLIQRLVKSNPSKDYIRRVARIFNNDGTGVRGNLAAVVKAILLDPEARDCEWISHPASGQLREPMVRYLQIANTLDVDQFYDRYWNSGHDYAVTTSQFVLAAPSVFNFFTPDYVPSGPLKSENLVAPEFQILHSRTAIGYINYVNYWAVFGIVSYSWEYNDPATYFLKEDLYKLARDPEVLVNRLDMLFTHGNLSDRTRTIIKNAIDEIKGVGYRADRVSLALYLLLISPDYVILK